MNLYWSYYILLISLVFYLTSCVHKNEKPIENKQQKIIKVIKPIILTPGIDTIKLPKKILCDTCIKPLQYAVPNKEGGSYYIYYEGYAELEIDFLPVIQKKLKSVCYDFEGNLCNNQYASGQGLFKTYTTDDGLPIDAFSCGICDSKGKLWFGTYGGGVSCFDGYDFINFSTIHGLANNIVWSLLEDSKGNIWIGTDNGLSCYNGKIIKNYTTKDGIADNLVWSLLEDSKGNIWIGTHNGVSCFMKNTIKNYTINDGLKSNVIWSIIEDKDGNIWFGTNGGGISCFDGKKFKNYNISDGLTSNNILSLLEDSKDNIWIGTDNDGISCLNKKENKIKSFTVSDGFISNAIRDIKEDSKGNIWFATDNGVCCYNGKTFTNYTKEQGLADNDVLSIIEDKNGSYWFTTYGSGITQYRGNAFISFNKSLGLSENLVWSITENVNNNNMYFATSNGFSIFDGKTFTQYNREQGLMNNYLRSVIKDKKSNFWFATDGAGIILFNGKSFINYNNHQGLNENIVWTLLEDKKGNIWIGTDNGLSCFDGKSFTNYNTHQGLINNLVWSLLEDSKGNIWIGTNNGVSCFDGYSFKNYSTTHGLANNIVWTISEDKYGNIWFGTNEGLSRYDGKSFLNYTVNNGLINNCITQIEFYNDKILLGSNNGIMEFETFVLNNKKQLPINNMSNFILKNYIPKIDVYNSSTGYPVKDVNVGKNAMYLDSKGILWVGTGSDKTALVRIDLQAINKNNKPPSVVLKNIHINNEKLSWYNLKLNNSKKNNDINDSIIKKLKNDSLAMLINEMTNYGKILDKSFRDTMIQKYEDIQFDDIASFNTIPQNLVLPYKNNHITFEFSAIELTRPYLVKYKYILEGYDNTWNPITNKTSASYGNIYEGTYTFKLKACSPDGIWSKPLIYSFTVLPPWWRTWWMISIYIFTSVFILYLFYKWRIHKNEKEKEVLEKIVATRTLKLEKANKEINKQKDYIEGIYSELTDSINYAKRIQNSVLTDINYLKKYFDDVFLLYQPKDVVSGDFYWCAEINNQIIVVVADCTGHGVPGAFTSMLGISLLKEIVIKEQITQPNLILNNLRNEIINSLSQQNNNIKNNVRDGMDMTICSINKNNHHIQWAGANNPLWLIKKEYNNIIYEKNYGSIIIESKKYNDYQLVFEEFKPDKMPISIYDRMDEFKLYETTIYKGDILYLITDGFPDQFGGPKSKKFLSYRLRKLVFEISNMPMDKQCQILNKTLISWMNDYNIKHNQTDDITILGIKI